MHPNRKFRIVDPAAMAELVREIGFGTLTVATPAGLRTVHVPVLLREDRLRFHVARGNEVHESLLAGADALFVVTGAHGYISPDWYGMEDRVPTWDYVAVELNGRVSPLPDGELAALLDDLSAEREARLAPKRPWTRDKMSPGRFEGLMKAITGFEMQITAWRGTAKLEQDRPEAVRLRVAEALEEQGEQALAACIRRGR
ncbi:MAG TPA: FMN-binding negative transcriptional regulator [Reyranellaceae bacterium]|nr:FMN-binding negative transcriptional regulator [Reyranellaceae bacterium]